MLARCIVAERSTTIAAQLREELGKRVADHLSLGRGAVLQQALVTMVQTHEGAPDPEERRLAEHAIEQLITAIEYQSTTREIRVPGRGGLGHRNVTAHLFAIPVCIVRGGGPKVVFQNLGEAASATDYLRVIEASVLGAITVPEDCRAMLRILDHVYAPQEIDAIGWVEARRLTLRAMCHFGGTEVPPDHLHQDTAQHPISGCAEVRYLIGVYCCEGEPPVFDEDAGVLGRLRSWVKAHRGAVMGYMAVRGVGRSDRVIVGMPSGLFSAERHGQAGVARHRFELEFEKYHLKDPGETAAEIDVVQDGSEVAFRVTLSAREGFWRIARAVGCVTRKTLPFEDARGVLDDIAAYLMTIGISCIEVVRAPEDFAYSNPDENAFRIPMH